MGLITFSRFSLRSLLLFVAVAAVAAFFIVRYWREPLPQHSIRVLDTLSHNNTAMRLYTIRFDNSVLHVYYDYAPYGSLDELMVEVPHKSFTTYVSKERDYFRTNRLLTAQDFDEFKAISELVAEKQGATLYKHNQPVSYKLKPDELAGVYSRHKARP